MSGSPPKTPALESAPLKPKPGAPSPTFGRERGRPLFVCSLAIFGPGLLAMLADTDAPCLIVAAQSGAEFGYSLVLLMVLLTPVLFLAQDLTVRLGVYTRMGLVGCIRNYFGKRTAIAMSMTLAFSGTLAEVSELSGIAVVCELWDMPLWAGVLGAATLLITVVFGLPYRAVEVIGIIFGLFECTFIVTMFMSDVSAREFFEGAVSVSFDADFFMLVTSNVGAVIMSWMLYFQQGAVVAKRIAPGYEEALERTDTLVGAIVTQLIMVAAMVTLAATRNITQTHTLDDVHEIVDAISITVGSKTAAKVLLSLAFAGGSLCAAFVVGLAVAWGLYEAFGGDIDSPSLSLKQTPLFYVGFLAVVALGAVVLLSGVDVVALNVVVEVIDALMMPITLLFIYLLATGPALPPESRVTGTHRWVCASCFLVVTVVAWVAFLWSLIGEVGRHEMSVSVLSNTFAGSGPLR